MNKNESAQHVETCQAESIPGCAKRPPRHEVARGGQRVRKHARVGLLLVDDGQLGGMSRRDTRLNRHVALLDDDLEVLVSGQTGSGGDETSHDDVLLEPAQVVGLSADRRFREDLGGLLEGRSADEGLGRKRSLRDAEEETFRDCWTSALLDDARVLALEDVLLDLLVDEEVRVADVLDANASHHLTNDDLDVLVVDGDALQAVDLL